MKTFAVIGLGRFGYTVATHLFECGNEVLAIDKDEDIIESISNHVTQAVACDAKNVDTLKQLGITNCDVVIVTIGANITDSVLTTLALKELNVPYVVCKASSENHKKILTKIGADLVMIPELEAGIKLAERLSSSIMIDQIELSSTCSLSETIVPKSWVGKTLATTEVRNKYHITIIGIKKHNSEDLTINPPSDYAFNKGDIILTVGNKKDLQIIASLS